MGCRSASLAVRCDIAGPNTAKQRKNERKQSNGYSVSIYRVSAGSSGTLEHSRAAVEISLEIYSGERKDAKVAAIVSALVGRLVLISLVPSVVEADVATVDGLESMINLHATGSGGNLLPFDSKKRVCSDTMLKVNWENKNTLVIEVSTSIYTVIRDGFFSTDERDNLVRLRKFVIANSIVL
ncbi:hypothetical protein GW17_00056732 [Ensete ventricosum]|nr:hypothetical protein GW17_00056732 [Ensete ventricosum]